MTETNELFPKEHTAAASEKKEKYGKIHYILTSNDCTRGNRLGAEEAHSGAH